MAFGAIEDRRPAHFARVRWREGVVELSEEEILESDTPSKFTTLVGADATAVLVPMVVEEFRDYVKRWVFGSREEDPDISGGLVDDQEVTGITIVRPDHSISAFVWA
jgi:hypothetical protein